MVTRPYAALLKCVISGPEDAITYLSMALRDEGEVGFLHALANVADRFDVCSADADDCDMMEDATAAVLNVTTTRNKR